jgi:glutathione S-transferase
LQETFGAVPLSNVASITASPLAEKFMLTVHHLGVSQSERIVWLCEELELPYELKLYKRSELGAAPPEYKALHPLGAAPVIGDGDVLLAESGAVMEYILGRYGEGRLVIRPEQPGYADYLYWLHFANGSMMPAEMVNLAPAGSGRMRSSIRCCNGAAPAAMPRLRWSTGACRKPHISPASCSPLPTS